MTDQPTLFDPEPPRDPVRCPRCGWRGEGRELAIVTEKGSMNHVGLFSGIGGFEEAFRRAGASCLAVCEIEPQAQSILRRHFPSAEVISDVQTITQESFAGRSIDILTGGFPCQDLSVAGRRAGLAGKRSGLWFEFVRIIGDHKPRWVVIENVPGLLSSNGGADFAIILRGLVELGYGVAYRILDSQFDGVAQRRRRVFIVASLGSGRCAEVLFEREGGAWNSPPSREAGERTAATITHSIMRSGGATAGNNGAPVNLVGFGDGIGLARCVTTGEAKRQDYETCTMIAHTLRAGGHDASEDGTGRGTPLVVAPELSIPLTASGRGTERIGESRGQDTLIAFTQNTRDEVRYINGDGAIAGALGAEPGMKQQNYVCAFTERTRTDGRNFEAQEELAYALTNPGSGGRTHSRQIAGGFGVRRLTPTECERLQGFEDGWTAYGHDGKAMSDSARYRMLGNAVCVPTVEWIARRIVAQAADEWGACEACSGGGEETIVEG